ncbi:MAG: hypothetical protein IKM88_11860, partial [Lachnospiraceae bacterium]|nr:hypothetical protein [Lachnospiraceae bacterium]
SERDVPMFHQSFPIFSSHVFWEHVPKIPKNVPTAVAQNAIFTLQQKPLRDARIIGKLPVERP